MNTKLDRRIVRTRKMLFDALTELILEKGYDTVSITDITKRAGIGRSTFYAHFENKEQLLFSGYDDLTLHISQHYKSTLPQHTLLLFKTLFSHAQANRQLAKAMVGQNGRYLMLDRMKDILITHFKHKAEHEILNTQQINLFAHAFAASIIGLVTHWIEEDHFNIDFMIHKGSETLDAFLTIAKN